MVEHRERVPVARTGDHRVAVEGRTIRKTSTGISELERISMQFRALAHHGRDEALVLTTELAEGTGPLLDVELADLLQDLPLLHGLILRAMFRDELLRQLVLILILFQQ